MNSGLLAFISENESSKKFYIKLEYLNNIK